MKKTLSHLITLVYVAAALFLVDRIVTLRAAESTITAKTRHLQALSKESADVRELPLLLRPQFFLEQLRPAGLGGADISGNGNHLVLILGHNSELSAADAELWIKHLTGPARFQGETWIVVDEATDKATKLADILGGRSRLLKLKNVDEFVRRTGISGVPTVLLTNGSELLQCAVGHLDDSQIETLISIAAGKQTFPNLFMFDSRPDVLQPTGARQ